MSEYQILAVLAGFAFVYSLIASRLERTPVNGALVYVFVGVLCGPGCLNLIDLKMDGEQISWLAELTLAVVLFTDSANAKLSVLRKFEAIPVRLLLIGLPLTIAIGFAVGRAMFSDLSLFEVALLATMLAPTDAALGKAVVTNDDVPTAVRESLNVESGLNDGICVPVLLFFLALSVGELERFQAVSLVAILPLKAIGVGAIVGLTLAFIGSFFLRYCSQKDWVDGDWLQIPVIALSLLIFALAQLLGGSGFIACFVAGLTFGALTHRHKHAVLEAAEGTGDVLGLLTWFAFGTMLLSFSSQAWDWRCICYALLSLTLIRIVSVFISVIGLKLRTDTKLFMGWFGPRGLATIVFLVMTVDAELPGIEKLAVTAAWTIVISIVAHGLSANPLARAYGRRVGEGAI